VQKLDTSNRMPQPWAEDVRRQADSLNLCLWNVRRAVYDLEDVLEQPAVAAAILDATAGEDELSPAMDYLLQQIEFAQGDVRSLRRVVDRHSPPETSADGEKEARFKRAIRAHGDAVLEEIISGGEPGPEGMTPKQHERIAREAFYKQVYGNPIDPAMVEGLLADLRDKTGKQAEADLEKLPRDFLVSLVLSLLARSGEATR
jgi:hypothetical protein